jgi:hypothetical protein
MSRRSSRPQEVQNLPLHQRATENLMAFIQGAVHGGASDQPSTSQPSINGSRTLNTEVLLNGVSTIVASTGTPATPSSDGVDSFRFLANQCAGGVWPHLGCGDLGEYHLRDQHVSRQSVFLVRSEAFEANQYFHKDTINPTTGAVTPRNRDPFFQEGGSFGGPIRIPHLYNGHDKTFIFVNYDRTAMPQLGDLSASLSATDANRELRRWRYSSPAV